MLEQFTFETSPSNVPRKSERLNYFLKTGPAVHDSHVLNGHHVSRLHLQPDVVLLGVHQVVKRPHRPVNLLHLRMTRSPGR